MHPLTLGMPQVLDRENGAVQQGRDLEGPPIACERRRPETWRWGSGSAGDEGCRQFPTVRSTRLLRSALSPLADFLL